MVTVVPLPPTPAVAGLSFFNQAMPTGREKYGTNRSRWALRFRVAARRAQATGSSGSRTTVTGTGLWRSSASATEPSAEPPAPMPVAPTTAASQP